LRTKILAGLLDSDANKPQRNRNDAKTAAIENVNLQAARKTVVLLKNQDSILPLSRTVTVTVIGPNGDVGNLNCFGSSETNPPFSRSLLDGVRALSNQTVNFQRGCDRTGSNTNNFEQAKTQARNSNYVIFAAGLSDAEEGEGYNQGRDRSEVQLPSIQQQLIRELATVNPNIIVVIQSGGVCSLSDETHTAIKGLVYSFYAGQMAGTAIAEVLYGVYNPAGRMPVTMPINQEQLPPWNDSFDDDYGVGYRWFDEMNRVPRYAFGFGLSYTTFTYSTLNAPTTVIAGEPFTVTVSVTNSGSIAGDEVVQLYVSSPSDASVWFPKKELRGFERVNLRAGEARTVSFRVTADERPRTDRPTTKQCIRRHTRQHTTWNTRIQNDGRTTRSTRTNVKHNRELISDRNSNVRIIRQTNNIRSWSSSRNRILGLWTYKRIRTMY